MKTNFLFAGCFDSDGKVLLIHKPFQRKGYVSAKMCLPGGKLPKGLLFDEEWKRFLFAKKIAEQTGFTHFEKDGKSVPIETDLQLSPVTVDCCKKYPIAIVGIVRDEAKSSVGALDIAAFHDFSDFMTRVYLREVSSVQEHLILRVFASKENPNKYDQEKAKKQLKEC